MRRASDGIPDNINVMNDIAVTKKGAATVSCLVLSSSLMMFISAHSLVAMSGAPFSYAVAVQRERHCLQGLLKPHAA